MSGETVDEAAPAPEPLGENEIIRDRNGVLIGLPVPGGTHPDAGPDAGVTHMIPIVTIPEGSTLGRPVTPEEIAAGHMAEAAELRAQLDAQAAELNALRAAENERLRAQVAAQEEELAATRAAANAPAAGGPEAPGGGEPA